MLHEYRVRGRPLAWHDTGPRFHAKVSTITGSAHEPRHPVPGTTFDAVTTGIGGIMKTWQEDQLSALCRSESEDELFGALTVIARGLGFDYCAYGLRSRLPLCKPRTFMFNNYPALWQARYHEQNYLEIDPTVAHGVHSLAPMLWPDTPEGEAAAFWADARAFGLCVGWAQSSRDTLGTVGMLTLARSGETLSDSELRDKSLKMSWLVHVVHLEMARLLIGRLLPEADTRLSKQEAKVLLWTAEGKTAGEVSDILDISERAVNFHLHNAMLKLGAANKTAAAVRAAMLGMI